MKGADSNKIIKQKHNFFKMLKKRLAELQPKITFSQLIL